MSDGIERWDQDADYLYNRASKRGVRPTEEQEEAFCQRVFELVSGGMFTEEAQRQAFSEVVG